MGKPLEVLPVLAGWVRGTLVGITLGLLTVFAIAWFLDPYQEDGTPRRMETHRQLGLPPCTFFLFTGMPCPSCGMTTSFALLVRGDAWNSLRANCVGTMLAAFCLAAVPWSIASAWIGRPLFILSLERALTIIVVFFISLLLGRWAIVLAVAWLDGTRF